MLTLYKLTSQNWTTRGPTQWGPGVTHTASGEGDLCGPGWLHAYTSPELALLFNLIHANIPDPVLWLSDGVEPIISDHGLKVGTTQLTTIEIAPLPTITTEQRVRFAILCALEVCREPVFVSWAERWLSGKDRSQAAMAWVILLPRKADAPATMMAARMAAWAAMPRVAADAAAASAVATITMNAGIPLDLADIAKRALDTDN